MNSGRALTTFAFVGACVSACASDPPPKPVEPAAPPLEIPPLPPPKDPEPRPTTRTAPPPRDIERSADDDAEPSPLALPCKADAECMTHRCNLRVGKCAFPCRSDRDCIAGATCFIGGGAMATCIPKSP